jgi:hypothetical protein
MVGEGGLVTITLRDRGEVDRCAEVYRAVVVSHGEAGRGIDSTPLMLFEHAPDPAAIRHALDAIPPEGLVGEDDALFLLITSFVGASAASIGDEAVARRCAASLEPFDSMFVLDGFAAVCYGPVSMWLGIIAAALGEADVAAGHFERALVSLAPLRAPLLEADVRRRRAALGVGAARQRNAFARDGEVWRVSFAGRQAAFADAKGVRDLAVLLARPNGEVHVLDLVGGGVVAGPASVALDPAARRAYEQRVRDLTEEIEEAERHHDDGRAARLDDERAAVLHELATSLGLGGRDRPAAGDPVERARKAVGMRIRAAVDRIDRELPELGRHLRNSVRTGVWCSYAPEQPVDWRL